MSVSINKRNVREGLEPRKEPYWASEIEPGRFIGFRKIDAERGSWIARVRDKDGTIAARRKRAPQKPVVVPGAEPKAATNAPQRYKVLGGLTPKFDYTAAVKAARDWFAEIDAGVTTREHVTVADACTAYVKHLTDEKRPKTAADAEWRFKKSVYETAFGRTLLTRLYTPVIEKWRQSLGMKPAGANRMMTSLRAALNLAVKHKQVAATAAQEWRAVQQYKKADGQRGKEHFLDVARRRALLAAAAGPDPDHPRAVRHLIEAALLTGARPGELVSATRSAFDTHTKTLKLVGKTGSRDIPLMGDALALFKRLAKSKLPAALLLTRDDGAAWTRIEWSRQIRAAAEAAVVKDDKGRVLKDEHGNDAKLPTDVCLYSCRHTYISQALQDGLTTLDVSTLTGTSLKMIQEHYGHICNDAVRERMAKMQML